MNNLDNLNEIKTLSKNNDFNIFKDKNSLLLIDKYITFLKDNLDINHNELLILIDLTIYNKYNDIFFSNKDYYLNTNYYINEFKKLFMYNYNKNIKYLNRYIQINKRDFNQLVKHLNNKKRIYSYFEDINNTNINFYLSIITSLEQTN